MVIVGWQTCIPNNSINEKTNYSFSPQMFPTFIPLQVRGYLDDSHVAPVLHIEQDEPFGVGGGEKGRVSVNANRLVPG